MKPTVLLDVDGVVADFCSFYKLCALRAGIDSQRLQVPITQWDVGDSLGLTRAEKDLVHQQLYRARAQKDLYPYPDAAFYVPQLQQIADVWFVTAPLKESPTWCYDRAAWISEHFASDQLIFAHTKKLIQGDFFVDDRLDHVKSWASWNDGTATLWEQPYNSVHVEIGEAAWAYELHCNWERLYEEVEMEREQHG